MQLTSLQLKNFRCFKQATFTFDRPIILIEGCNGSGKTSLLEAIHYLCYIRSFRVPSPRDLIQLGHDTFFIKAHFNEIHQERVIPNTIQVGFTGKKRLVKLNQHVISSYKELIDHYRVITITEDDLNLIKGSPDGRRSFIDHVLLLHDPLFIKTIRSVKHVLENRNSLLQASSNKMDSYELWSRQLWEKSCVVQLSRKAILKKLEERVEKLRCRYLNEVGLIALSYITKRGDFASYDDFMTMNPTLYREEHRFGRSLFGAHLDDISITFQSEKSKTFASRGQQKLIVLLIKIAQVQELLEQKGQALFLLDDFMTDFDSKRSEVFLEVLSNLESQLIFTSPAHSDRFRDSIQALQGQIVSLQIE